MEGARLVLAWQKAITVIVDAIKVETGRGAVQFKLLNGLTAEKSAESHREPIM